MRLFFQHTGPLVFVTIRLSTIAAFINTPASFHIDRAVFSSTSLRTALPPSDESHCPPASPLILPEKQKTMATASHRRHRLQINSNHSQQICHQENQARITIVLSVFIGVIGVNPC